MGDITSLTTNGSTTVSTGAAPPTFTAPQKEIHVKGHTIKPDNPPDRQQSMRVTTIATASMPITKPTTSSSPPMKRVLPKSFSPFHIFSKIGSTVKSLLSASTRPHLQTRRQIFNTITQTGSFASRSKALMKKLGDICPTQSKNIKDFAADPTNAALIKTLKDKGGYVAFKNQATSEEIIKMGDFRTQVTQLAINLCLASLVARGVDPPGELKAFGTPGAKSDVDLVYYAPPGLKQEDQMAVKLQFDMIMKDVFGEECDKLFDIVTYAQNDCDNEKLIHTPAGKAAFAQLELSGASLQMLRQCGGKIDSPKWESYKDKMLEGYPENSKTYEAIAKCFSDVEQLQKDVISGTEEQLLQDHQGSEEAVKELKSTPDKYDAAFKNATIGYRMKGLMEISKKIDACQKKIDERNQLTQANGKAYAEIMDDEDKLSTDKLQIELATLYLVRSSFVEEGFNTQGAYLKICSNERGQIHQRKVDEIQHMLASGVTSLFGYELDAAQVKKTTAQQNASSASENLAYYLGHYSHADSLSEHQKALTVTSKYSQRVLTANAELIQQSLERATKDGDPKLIAAAKTLLVQNQELFSKSVELEKVKRETQLNRFSTEERLFKALSPKNEPSDKIRAIVKEIIELSEPDGKIGDKFEESLSPQDKYLVLWTKLASRGLISPADPPPLPKGVERTTENLRKNNTDFFQSIWNKLAAHGLISRADSPPLQDGVEHATERLRQHNTDFLELTHHGFQPSTSPEIDAILKARVGAPAELGGAEMRAIFKQADEIRDTTMSKLELTTSEKIDEYNENIIDVTIKIQNLSIATGVLTAPSTDLFEPKKKSLDSPQTQILSSCWGGALAASATEVPV